MNSRRYGSQVKNFGVERQEDYAVDIVPRRYGPIKRSRNLVWTAPEPNGSTTGYNKKNTVYGPRSSSVVKSSRNLVWTASQGNGPKGNQLRKNGDAYGPSGRDSRGLGSSGGKGSPKSKGMLCKFWKDGNCKKAEHCLFLHAWSSFPGLKMVAELEGHNKDIKGIALPQGSDKLFSASVDGTFCVWDCNTGKCVHTINLQAEPGSVMSEGPWVFLGLPNVVKAFNVQTTKEVHLNGVVGLVHAMTTANGMLFAGTSSGSISVWKATNNESDPFTYLTSLEGHHSGQVTCFIVGGQRLYSGSVDKTIKVWDLNTLQCTMTLRQHTDTVTSLLCWDKVLISASLDGTIKVWACSENNGLKVTSTRRQEQSVHALCGVHDANGKPIMFCSYENGMVSIVDLPLHRFEERGKMFSMDTVGTIATGPDGLVFTGDKSGKLRVWSLAATKA